MTKVCEVKSGIEDLKITINEAITIYVQNFFDCFFTQFFGILSNKTKEKEKLLILESLAKSLENEKLQIKNQN